MERERKKERKKEKERERERNVELFRCVGFQVESNPTAVVWLLSMISLLRCLTSARLHSKSGNEDARFSFHLFLAGAGSVNPLHIRFPTHLAPFICIIDDSLERMKFAGLEAESNRER